MNRSRLAALSAGAMFLVASVFAPAVATADSGGTNTIKVINVPAPFNPPVSTGSFTVSIVANGSVAISGAGSGLTFDNTKLQLTALAKDSTEVLAGAGYLGFPGAGTATTTFIANANAAGQIPNISWSYLDGTSSDVANADHGIYTATFSIIASGDSQLVPVAASMLDGQAGTYGSPLAPLALSNGVVKNSVAPIWSLSAPASATVLTGTTSAGSTITTAVTSGTTGSIALTASGMPAGVTASFSPTSLSGAGTSTLTFDASTAAVTDIGTYTVTVTATDSETTPVAKTQTISLSVVGNNDFTVSAAPGSVSVIGGGAASSPVTVSTVVVNGAPGTVALSTSTLPTGVTASFTPASVAAGGTASLTFTADATASSGTTTVTISGTNGTYTHTTSVGINVIVGANANSTVGVTASLAAGYLGLTCPTNLSIALLRGNTNQINVPCAIATNGSWSLNVADAHAPVDASQGHMVTGRPVDGTTTFAMPDSMHVLTGAYTSGGDVFYTKDVDLTAGGTALSGTTSGAAALVLSQYVAANAHPGTYAIEITFSAVQGF